jgi:hypothetical protein
MSIKSNFKRKSRRDSYRDEVTERIGCFHDLGA